jgi:hypothetical protein
MTERVQGPASYFPSIEKKYGKPIGYWLDLINSSPLTRHKAEHGIGHGHATALVGYALAHRSADGTQPSS